jgi:hypothetical protein
MWQNAFFWGGGAIFRGDRPFEASRIVPCHRPQPPGTAALTGKSEVETRPRPVACPQVREYLNRSTTRLDSLSNLPAEISAHLTSCTNCLADRRVAWMRRPKAVPPPRARTRPIVWAALVAALGVLIWVVARAGLFRSHP